MTNQLDLKLLWSEQVTPAPAPSKIIHKANRYKRNNHLKLMIINALMLVTAVLLGFIWLYFQPQYLTTKLGISLVIGILIVFLWGYNRTFALLRKTNEQTSSKEYLQHFIALKEKQHYLQTTLLSLYFAFLSVGLLLYLWEYAVQMPFLWACFTYGTSGLWLAFNWFYLRPRTIRKQRAVLDAIIEDLSQISAQIS